MKWIFAFSFFYLYFYQINSNKNAVISSFCLSYAYFIFSHLYVSFNFSILTLSRSVCVFYSILLFCNMIIIFFPISWPEHCFPALLSLIVAPQYLNQDQFHLHQV